MMVAAGALRAAVIALLAVSQAGACNNTDGWLSDIPVPGYHVLCIRPESTRRIGVDAANAAGVISHGGLADGDARLLRITAYRRGLVAPTTTTALRIPRSGAGASPSAWMRAFRAGVERAVKMADTATDRSWFARRAIALDKLAAAPLERGAAFDAERFFPQRWRALGAAGGKPVESVQRDVVAAAEAAEAETRGLLLLVFEGGQFLWPGVRLGYRREVAVLGRTVALTTLSLRPVVLRARGVLRPRECAALVARAEARGLRASRVGSRHARVRDPFRTSATAMFPADPGDDAVRAALEARAAALTRTRLHQQEPLQVVRYTDGQSYGAHHDYFPVSIRA